MDRLFGPGASEFKARKFAENGCKCPRCGRDEPGGNGGWHLDHDHHYEQSDPEGWRDVLCNYCNLAMGYIEKGGWDAVAFVDSLREAP